MIDHYKTTDVLIKFYNKHLGPTLDKKPRLRNKIELLAKEFEKRMNKQKLEASTGEKEGENNGPT